MKEHIKHSNSNSNIKIVEKKENLDDLSKNMVDDIFGSAINNTNDKNKEEKNNENKEKKLHHHHKKKDFESKDDDKKKKRKRYYRLKTKKFKRKR